MNINLKKAGLAGAIASIVSLSACTTTGAGVETDAESALRAENARTAELDQRARKLDAREAELQARQSKTATAQTDASELMVANDLLPPNAAPGECYARVWVDAQYRTTSERVQTSEASTKIKVIPAVYETTSKTIEVSAASSRLETIAAVYGTESETIKIMDGQRVWRIDSGANDAPANDALLAAATAHGINLDNAQPGQCFHEHYLPKTYNTVTEQVMTQAATETVNIIPAKYEMVEETVLVKEASTKLVKVPAQYGTETESILDKPAHTIWKKGKGPIQRIDESTGEIMCLVEVPATYKTVTRTVLTSPARTETVEVPAVYKTVKIRKQVSAASEVRTPVEPVYGTVNRKVVDNAGGFTWHEVNNMEHPASTRTGNKICLTESEPKYKTVKRKVVKTPAQTRTVEIPAKYKDVDVAKLVSPAREEVTEIPAEYGTVEKRELLKDGYMAWRSILCETNMTQSRITDIQRALIKAGYDVGPRGADGIIGASTIAAVNAFQTANKLPVDRYLNIQTLKALGVSINK